MIKGKGIAHVTLTVADAVRSRKFYEELFGEKIDFNERYLSFSLKDQGIPVWFWQRDKNSKDKFDEKRVGLDHIAFEVENVAVLHEIAGKLISMRIKTVGIEKFANKYPYICFRDPDNIQIEFFISN